VRIRSSRGRRDHDRESFGGRDVSVKHSAEPAPAMKWRLQHLQKVIISQRKVGRGGLVLGPPDVLGNGTFLYPRHGGGKRNINETLPEPLTINAGSLTPRTKEKSKGKRTRAKTALFSGVGSRKRGGTSSEQNEKKSGTNPGVPVQQKVRYLGTGQDRFFS